MLRTHLLLKEGRTRDAAICTERIETLARDQRFSSDDTLQASLALARAQILVATGDARQGATILRDLQAVSCCKRNNYRALQLSIQLADALLGCGDQAEGRAMLIQALQVGARAGVYQTFVDAERTCRVLVVPSPRHSAGQRLPPELRPYIGSILADRAQQRTRALPTRASRVTESLSPREHSILRSMSYGLSNKRIAQELQIAPETVKSHVKGIFISSPCSRALTPSRRPALWDCSEPRCARWRHPVSRLRNGRGAPLAVRLAEALGLPLARRRRILGGSNRQHMGTTALDVDSRERAPPSEEGVLV